eukprot:COSAG04_NODE_962_length_9154_cov_68.379680_8_plen_75_part_00
MTLARSPLRVMQFISSLDHTKLNVSPTMLWHERQLNTTGAATPSIDHRTQQSQRACAVNQLLRASALVDWKTSG